MFTIKVRIGSCSGVGEGGGSTLRSTQNQMACKVLSPFVAVDLRVFDCTFVLCSFLYS